MTKQEITKRISSLPTKAVDLSEFILVGKKALIAQKAKLEAIQKVEKGFAAKEAALSDTQDLAEVLLYAEAKLGELCEIIQSEQGKRTDLLGDSDVTKLEKIAPKIERSRAKQLNNNRDIIAEIVAKAREQGEVPIRQQVLREIRLAQPKPQPQPIPEGKYEIIYADPPWQYGDKLTENYGTVEHHYSPMSIKEICDMPIEDRAAENSVLFLWVTSPILAECWDVISAWGFEYKASFVWDKIKHNYGHYNSVRHEFLLICTRGSFLPQSNKLFDSVQSIERTSRHSEKPEQFRKIIEEMYPEGKRIELFARKNTQGWSVYGDEC